MRRPLWLLAAAPVLLGFTCVEKSAVNPKAIRHNTQGAELLARGALDEAETHFDLAIEYHPRFEKPHYNKGLIAFRRGDLEAALGHFLRAADMNPDYADAYNGVGRVFLKRIAHQTGWMELPVPLWNHPGVAAGDGHGTLEQCQGQDFIDAIVEDRPPLIHAREGATSCAALICALEAARTRERVKIPSF